MKPEAIYKSADGITLDHAGSFIRGKAAAAEQAFGNQPLPGSGIALVIGRINSHNP